VTELETTAELEAVTGEPDVALDPGAELVSEPEVDTMLEEPATELDPATELVPLLAGIEDDAEAMKDEAGREEEPSPPAELDGTAEVVEIEPGVEELNNTAEADVDDDVGTATLEELGTMTEESTGRLGVELPSIVIVLD